MQRRKSAGQTLAEFALIIPIFLLILFGMLDFGIFVFSDTVMSQAAREGARVGSAQAAWIGATTAQEPGCANGAPVCPVNEAAMVSNITTAVRNASSGLTSAVTVRVRCDPAGAPPAAGWTTGNCSSNRTVGDLVSVRLEYTYTPITPVGRVFLGTRVRSGAATMVIN